MCPLLTIYGVVIIYIVEIKSVVKPETNFIGKETLITQLLSECVYLLILERPLIR